MAVVGEIVRFERNTERGPWQRIIIKLKDKEQEIFEVGEPVELSGHDGVFWIWVIEDGREKKTVDKGPLITIGRTRARVVYNAFMQVTPHRLTKLPDMLRIAAEVTDPATGR